MAKSSSAQLNLILQAVNNTQGAFQQLNQSLAGLTSSLTSLGTQLNAQGAAISSLTQNLGTMNQNLAQGTQHAHNMGSAMQRWVVPAALIMSVRYLKDGIQEAAMALTKYLADIETAGLSIASSFMLNGQYVDGVTGKVLKGQDALHAAQSMSKDMIDQLRVENFKTIATLDQLIYAYQVTLPVAMSKGLNTQQVKNFTTAMMQAAGSIGLPFDQIAEETRSLLLGTLNSRTSRIGTILYGDVKKANQELRGLSGDALYGKLVKDLEAYAMTGVASMNTWKGAISNLKDIILQLGSQAFEPVFESAKSYVLELTKGIMSLETVTDELGNSTTKIKWSESALEWVKGMQEGFHMLINFLGDAIRTITALWEFLEPIRGTAFYLAVAAGLSVIEVALARAAVAGGWIGVAVTGLNAIAAYSLKNINDNRTASKDLTEAITLARKDMSPEAQERYLPNIKETKTEWKTSVMGRYKDTSTTVLSTPETGTEGFKAKELFDTLQSYNLPTDAKSLARYLSSGLIVAVPNTGLKKVAQGDYSWEVAGGSDQLRAAAEAAKGGTEAKAPYKQNKRNLTDDAEIKRARDAQVAEVKSRYQELLDAEDNRLKEYLNQVAQEASDAKKVAALDTHPEIDRRAQSEMERLRSNADNNKQDIWSARYRELKALPPTGDKSNPAKWAEEVWKEYSHAWDKLQGDKSTRNTQEAIKDAEAQMLADKKAFDNKVQLAEKGYKLIKDIAKDAEAADKRKVDLGDMTPSVFTARKNERDLSELTTREEMLQSLLQEDAVENHRNMTAKERVVLFEELLSISRKINDTSGREDDQKRADRATQVLANEKKIAEFRRQIADIDMAEKDLGMPRAEADAARLAILEKILGVTKEQLLLVEGKHAYEAKSKDVDQLQEEYRTQAQKARESNSESLTSGMSWGFKKFAAEAKSTFEYGMDLAQSTAQQMTASLSEGFFDVLSGKFNTMRKVAGDFFAAIGKMIANMLAQMAVNKMFQYFMGGSSFFGEASADGSTWTHEDVTKVFRHQGGPIYPKFHGGGLPGLAPGEVNITALVGEGVLSRKGVENLGKLNSGGLGGGGDVYVDMPISITGDAVSSDSKSNSQQASAFGNMLKSAVVQVIIEQKRSGGLLA